MQIKNQNRFGVIHFSIALVLSISIFSCSKSGQLDQGLKSAEEFSTVANGSSAASTYQGQQLWPLDENVWIPCANDGKGEFVHFTGYVHFTSQMTTNSNHFTLISTINPNEVSGVGLTTGTHYVASGGGTEVYIGSFNSGQWVAAGTTRFIYTGAGPGNNLSVTYKAHVVVNANGEVSNQLQDSKYSCN